MMLKVCDLKEILDRLPPHTPIVVDGRSADFAVPIYGAASLRDRSPVSPPLHLEIVLCPN
jgi:hypothetical protein